MKNIYLKFLSFTFVIITTSVKSQTFTVGAPSGNYTLTCLNPAVTMTANSGNSPFSYTWATTGSTINGVYANVTVPGSWTVTGQSLTSTVTAQTTFTVYSNLQTPTIVVTPTVGNLTCSGSSGCFTLTSNLSPNATTNWYTMMGANKVYVGAFQGTINILCPGNPGIYWAESVNNLTGCASTKSVLVTSSVGVPSFSVTSPTNFTIGCASKSITSMQVTSVVTSPVPNVPVNYTFMVPPVTSTPTTFTVNPNLNNITIPGTYVVYVKDLTNNCVSSMSINVIQNTVTPSVYFIQPTSLLTCANSSMILSGVSNNTNTIITWTVPASPSPTVNPTPTHTLYTNPAIVNSTTQITSLGTLTVGASDNNNFCVATKTLQVTQDIRKPIFTIAALSNSVINCITVDAVIVPVITPTIALALVPTYIWYAPPSYTPVSGTQYNTTVGGTHSAIATAAINGCTHSATYVVATDLNAPAITATVLGVGCPFTGQSTITAVTGPITNATYTWSGTGLTGSLNNAIATATALGTYTCAATNTVNGCSDTVVVSLICNTGISNNGTTNNSVNVYPNPSKGAITIEVNTISSEMKLSIYDVQGKLITETMFDNITNKIETDLPKGCYFYKVTNGEMVLKRDKLIIE